MTDPLGTRCHELLIRLGLASRHSSVTAEPLSGGVASDIAKVTVDGQVFCIKFALPKLRVAADWFAPVERNTAEYHWLKSVSAISPQSVPTLFGHSEPDKGFVMDYLDSDNTVLLKTEMLEGRGISAHAKAIGHLLGQIHAYSTQSGFEQGYFHNHDDFYALRIEPYLVYTAEIHPPLKPALLEMAETLYQANTVLIHGDVSPKNILFHHDHPVILDAECATLGDASFDLAFCMNHFILKSFHMPTHADRYRSMVMSLWTAYKPFICWEDTNHLEQRVTQLVPMLMLARIDGKSPVEYLNKQTQDDVRSLAIQGIKTPPSNLSSFLNNLI